jgi:hypothetical protein
MSNVIVTRLGSVMVSVIAIRLSFAGSNLAEDMDFLRAI